MTSRYRINLSDAVDDMAPPPPPCFLNRSIWVEYLKSAAASQNQRDEPKLFIYTAGGAVRLNYEFPYCADCTQVKSLEMDRLGKCKPDYLKQLGEKHGRTETAD